MSDTLSNPLNTPGGVNANIPLQAKAAPAANPLQQVARLTQAANAIRAAQGQPPQTGGGGGHQKGVAGLVGKSMPQGVTAPGWTGTNGVAGWAHPAMTVGQPSWLSGLMSPPD